MFNKEIVANKIVELRVFRTKLGLNPVLGVTLWPDLPTGTVLKLL